ncbi:MAG: c-type cytochrome [Planctomycetota bacterium]|nr:c-type cytochrome [Planctomycetota bacterium]
MRPAGRRTVLVLAGVLAALAGCRGERTDAPPRQFFPDMDDQPKYKAQSASAFFEDGRSMRPPPRGAVPFGAKAFSVEFEDVDFARREEYLREDANVYEGRYPALDAAGKPVLEADGLQRYTYVARIPIPVDDRLLALGEKKYNIYCIVCHGGTGAGDGTVGKRWSYPLPSFHDPKYYAGGEKGQDGYIFHTILNGVPNVGQNVPYPLKMPAYRNKISEREAWAIVAYFRALQTARNAPLEAVPERERQDLDRRRPAAAPGAAAAVNSDGKERGS